MWVEPVVRWHSSSPSSSSSSSSSSSCINETLPLLSSSGWTLLTSNCYFELACRHISTSSASLAGVDKKSHYDTDLLLQLQRTARFRILMRRRRAEEEATALLAVAEGEQEIQQHRSSCCCWYRLRGRRHAPADLPHHEGELLRLVVLQLLQQRHEVPLQHYRCCIMLETKCEGTMWISPNCIYFTSSIGGTKLVLPLHELVSIDVEQTASSLESLETLELCTAVGKFYFADFELSYSEKLRRQQQRQQREHQQRRTKNKKERNNHHHLFRRMDEAQQEKHLTPILEAYFVLEQLWEFVLDRILHFSLAALDGTEQDHKVQLEDDEEEGGDVAMVDYNNDEKRRGDGEEMMTDHEPHIHSSMEEYYETSPLHMTFPLTAKSLLHHKQVMDYYSLFGLPMDSPKETT
ncbi:hypothetical protein QOT17_023580, partial [Balamuthia mandrillaris]